MRDNLSEYFYETEVSPDYFARMTNWLLAWQKRDPSMEFSLLMIDFIDPDKLGSTLGAKYAMELLKRVASEINSALRVTDLSCRTGVSCFWILLPHGKPELVLDKLSPIIATARQDGMDASSLKVRRLIVSPKVVNSDSAIELFAHLQNMDG